MKHILSIQSDILNSNIYMKHETARDATEEENDTNKQEVGGGS